MTEKPKIAEKSPIKVELEEGKNYWFCACGHSSKQPFCDGSHSKVSSLQPLKFTAEKTGPAWLCQCKHSSKLPFCDGTHSKIDE